MISSLFSFEVSAALERETANLFGYVDDIVAGLGREHHAAVGELRRAVAMVACAAGAFLPVDLAAAAPYFIAGESGLGALALVGQNGAHHKVHRRGVDLGAAKIASLSSTSPMAFPSIL